MIFPSNYNVKFPSGLLNCCIYSFMVMLLEMFFIFPSALVSCFLLSALMHFAVSSAEGEWVTQENPGGGSWKYDRGARGWLDFNAPDKTLSAERSATILLSALLSCRNDHNWNVSWWDGRTYFNPHCFNRNQESVGLTIFLAITTGLCAANSAISTK